MELGARDGPAPAQVPSQFAEVQPYVHVRRLLEVQVDMQFHDLHSLLRLPLPDQGLVGGCNLTATALLCSIIAGASVLFWDSSIEAIEQRGNRGHRFKGVMTDYFPWLAGDVVNPEDGAEALWDYTRSPLTHTLGVAKAPHLLPGAPGDGRPVVLMRTKAGLSAECVDRLVRETTPPEWTRFPDEPAATFTEDGEVLDIHVEMLAWGTHRLLHNLFADEEEMRKADDTAWRLFGGS